MKLKGLSLLILLSACTSPTAAPPSGGLVVTGIAPAGLAHGAGIRVNDLLLSWSQKNDPQQPLDHAFQWWDLQDLAAPNGPVTLYLWRNNNYHIVRLGDGDWACRVRPIFKHTERPNKPKRTHIDPLQLDAQTLHTAQTILAAGHPRTAAWLSLLAAESPERQANPTALYGLLDTALRAARSIGPRATARVQERIAHIYQGLECRDLALKALQQALALRQHPLHKARLDRLIGNLIYRQTRDLDVVLPYWERALAVHQQLAPDTLEAAKIYNNMGVAAKQLGHLDRAEQFYSRALQIKRELQSGSKSLANTLTNLGHMAKQRGRLEQAAVHYQEALPIYTGLNLHQARASVLTGLGNVQTDRKNLSVALEYYQHAHGILTAHDPQSVSMLQLERSIGVVHVEMGDYEQARHHYAGAIQIAEEFPNAPFQAAILNDLGQLEIHAGQAQKALIHLNAAATYLRDGRHINLRAHNLRLKAQAALLSNQEDAALVFLQAALPLSQASMPNSYDTAMTHRLLAQIHQNAGRGVLAGEHLAHAVDVIERQNAALGGDRGVRARFSLSFLEYYRDLIQLLAARGDTEAAFNIFERSRAPIFMRMLAARDLIPSDPNHPLLAQKAQLEEALAKATDPNRISELRLQWRDVDSRIRSAQPGDPLHTKPLNVRQTRAALDPGTLMLAYSVRADQTTLFVLSANQAGPPQVHQLGIGATALNQQVAVFRREIQKRRRTPHGEAALHRRARSLYTHLIQPAQAAVDSAQRVLIVADGPLHLLPFAALQDSQDRYFVAQKPLHTVLSGSLYARFRQGRRQDTGKPLLVTAFGDPNFPDKLYKALPATRLEVAHLAELYGDSAEILLGDAAREAKAKALAGDRRIVHFATHGRVQADLPLESALILAPGGPHPGDDGLLHTWEIIQDLRINADLVVLSACETAVGEDMGGEGLIGLTRAFQYAGARAVLSSLWTVNDQSTARLMQHFHAALAAGLPRDEALQQAQLALIQSGGGDAHPYHWAAFSLTGDRG